MKYLFLLLTLAVLSCRHKTTQRKELVKDSTGSNGGTLFRLNTKRIPGVYRTVESTYPTFEIEIANDTGTVASKMNGKWTISNPEVSLEMMYESMMRQDSLYNRPFVVITLDDTLHFYHGDTIHIGPDPHLIQL